MQSMHLYQYLSQVPIVFVCLVGAVFAFMFYKREPLAALLTLLALGLTILLCIVPIAVQQLLVQSMQGGGRDRKELSQTMAAMSLVWAIFRAGSYVLLLAAVFVGRQKEKTEIEA